LRQHSHPAHIPQEGAGSSRQCTPIAATNLLSVAAAFGVLVLVFQHGWAKGILGFA